ncbi:hypothetical protein CAEBREN_29209 [Caenorhabditis brenneri]|uniref:Uncharacterized protein n=1 Tax=Caenorhabditis brenneri TaxID=135651 RepID=G0P476_CAEBE|nr:hypothetical protein CAEBREN_29209 [Caenorhabditis brenneri]
MEPNFQATRQHQKQTQNVSSQPAKPVVDSEYQNLAELTSSAPISNENAHFYLPPDADSKKVEIKKVEFETEYSNGQPFINYEVCWVEKKSDKKSIPDKTVYSSISIKSSDSEESSDTDGPVPLVKKTSSMMKIPGKGRCDGPCGKIVDLSTTVQFGCDHAICDVCRKKTPSVALFDGSPGCCNEACVQKAKADGDKLCSGQSDSTSSVVTQVGVVESVPTHICILKNYGKDVLRTQLEYEYPTSARLSLIVKSLNHYKDLMANSRFYYCTYKPARRSDLIPISLTDTNQRFHHILDLKTPPILYVLIVGKDIQFFDTR